jgi:glycosyltransferase involved in cell wall biosynthesis
VRILHVVPTYLPARRYGGPIVAVHGLAKSLVARGHDVDVVTTNVDGDNISDVPISTPVDLDGVHVRYFPSPVRRVYWSPQMRKALRDHVREYQVVHLHSVFLWPTFAAATAARGAKVPYVISPRGMLVNDLIARKSTFAKKSWIRLIERRNFATASAIHFTTQREWDDANDVGLPLPSPFVVPNGIDLPPRRQLARDDAMILFLGRINWKKSIDVLIESLVWAPQMRLVVAGNDEEHYVPRLSELAERIGVANRVEFRGAVRGEEKDFLLGTARVLVLPSISENFGNVVIEAMAASTPVIVSPGVGVADYVARAKAGYVVARNPRAIAESIADVRPEMGERGRKLVEERFTWPRVAEEMEREYERLRR